MRNPAINLKRIAPLLQELEAIDAGSIVNGVSYHELSMTVKADEVVIKGNAEGLIQLASHILRLAINNEQGCHIHFDNRGGMLDDSDRELVVTKTHESRFQPPATANR